MARKPLRHIFSMLGLALLLVLVCAPNARGADARMTRDESQLVAAQFLDGMLNNGAFAQVCRPDLVVSLADSGQTLVGVGLADQAFDQIMKLNHATDATVESLIVGEGNASAEIAMTGNVLDANGTIAEPGRVVRTSYSLFLTMDAGKVTALRIYGLDQLIAITSKNSVDTYYPIQIFPGKPY